MSFPGEEAIGSIYFILTARQLQYCRYPQAEIPILNLKISIYIYTFLLNYKIWKMQKNLKMLAAILQSTDVNVLVYFISFFPFCV